MKLSLLMCALALFAPQVAAQCKDVPNSPIPRLDCLDETRIVEGGEGDKWGQWYRLKSTPVPAGYQIEYVSFRLMGPHPCSGDMGYIVGKATKPAKEDVFKGILDSITGIPIGKINIVKLSAPRTAGILRGSHG